jgi:hypothetical protein
LEDNIKMYCMIREWVLECGLGSFGSREGPVVGSCELSNEILGSIKGMEFLD